MRTKRQLVIWLSDDEKKILKEKADAELGPDGRPMSVSAYVRMLIFNPPTR